VLVRRLGVIAARTATRLDDVAVAALESTKMLVMTVVGLYVGSLMLALPEGVRVIVTRSAITIGLVQGAIWGNAALRSWLVQYSRTAPPIRRAPPRPRRSASSRGWCCGS
jgi:hypothetical protein